MRRQPPQSCAACLAYQKAHELKVNCFKKVFQEGYNFHSIRSRLPNWPIPDNTYVRSWDYVLITQQHFAFLIPVVYKPMID